jgi:hypothetical protein
MASVRVGLSGISQCGWYLEFCFAAHKRFEEEAPGKDIDILISEGRDLTARSTISETAQTEQSVI